MIASAAGPSLTFTVPYDAIIAANQTLTAVVYEPDRDEWLVLTPVVNVDSDGTATIDLSSLTSRLSPLNVALVYPDQGSGSTLQTPPLPVAGSPLQGVPRVDLASRLSSLASSLSFDPPVVLPTGRAVGTLVVTSSLASPLSPLLPSGTAVQAWIDEELHLSNGATTTDTPFSTDLVLYRSLDGSELQADFHLAPARKRRRWCCSPVRTTFAYSRTPTVSSAERSSARGGTCARRRQM